MAVLEVVMLIIGLGAVFLSFRASDNSASPVMEEVNKEELKSVSQEIKEALEKFDKNLYEKAEEMINSTDDKLSTMLNEKIMGLSEYSQQIFDKMENNHSETVFLYDMLNEKEKDIKKLINDVDVAKASIRDEIANQYQELKKNTPTPVVKETVDGIPDELLYSDNSSHTAMYDEEIAKIEEQEQKERHEKSLEKLYGNMGIDGIDAAAIEAGIEYVDHSDEIIKLYNKGHSVLEISKMLEIGQGEVKLVIDMYEAG